MITVIENHDCFEAGLLLVVQSDRELQQIQRCAGILESVTLMPDGNYNVSGRGERNGVPPATLEQILAELETITV